MRKPFSLRVQRGYLMEIPILLILVFMAVAITLPHLPPLGKRIMLGLAAVPVLFCLYYMIVTPGWMPGDRKRLRWPWSLIVFLIVTAAIVAGVVAVIIS
jgi:hypothetical protein